MSCGRHDRCLRRASHGSDHVKLRTIDAHFPAKRYSLKNPSEKFEKAIVVHFAIVIPAARHNFDGDNTTQICGKAR